MASNRPAPEPRYAPHPHGAFPDGFDPYGSTRAFTVPAPRGAYQHQGAYQDQWEAEGHGTAYFDAYPGPEQPEAEDDYQEWNPTEDTVRPVRGRHRVAKQRGGLARSSTVLGVGVIAAVGAGGIASAQGKPPVSVSVPDLSTVTDSLPDAKSLPGVGSLISDDSGDETTTQAAPLTGAGLTTTDTEDGTTDAGEALRSRILQQAEQQQDHASSAAAAAAQDAAAQKAAEEAASQQKKAADDIKAKKEAAKKKAAEEAAKKRERERLAKLAKSFSLPAVSYTLTSHFGDPGAMWSSGHHTGLDFAAPTGTPLKAIHTATVKEAGWAGAYGYRTVLELDDGTELWYCHQSSLNVSAGQKVTTGDTIGRVGATGNVTGPHLHLEVHPGGAGAIDPLGWLQNKGINP
ncbi:M23 family metallopeptidase [Streptomyces sp. NPDC058045]|uniref:M23 family metallopeptidase n=1 Tax=Streptomyces sp. NPDC058045 TaxID=3346311 RepID=UPI0036EA5949